LGFLKEINLSKLQGELGEVEQSTLST